VQLDGSVLYDEDERLFKMWYMSAPGKKFEREMTSRPDALGQKAMREWKKRKKRQEVFRRPDLSVTQILAWADAHHACTGAWPRHDSGPILEGPLGENWRKVDNALRYGLRGLPGGSSLPKLLAAERGVRNRKGLPPLTEALILSWADAHFSRHGSWPHQDLGPIPEAPGESWGGVAHALLEGLRGLAGGSSLAQLLADERGVRNRAGLPRLTLRQVRVWAAAHRERTGQWPNADSGPIPEAPGETWSAVRVALSLGRRGLPAGSSLARMLGADRRLRQRRTGSRP
jgi:hypothetical protein